MPVELNWETLGDRINLTFSWTDEAEVNAEVTDDQELLIRFSKGITLPALSQAMPVLRDWSDQINVSYDTFFLKLNPDLEVKTTPSRFGITVTLINPYRKDVPLDDAALGFKLVEVQFLLQRGRPLQAMELLNKLQRSNRRNPSVLMALAAAHLELGNWAEALFVADQAIELEPNNEGFRDFRRALLKVRGTEAYASARHLWTKRILVQDIGLIGFNWRFYDLAYLGAYHEWNDYLANSLRPLAPEVPAKTAGHIQRQVNFVGADLPFHLSAQFNWYYQEQIKGTGLDLKASDLFGETRLFLHQKEPYWGLAEGLLGETSRDETRLERLFRLGPQYELMAALSKRHYDVIGEQNLADTQAFDGYFYYSERNPYWLVDRTNAPSLARWEFYWTYEKPLDYTSSYDRFGSLFEQHLYIFRLLVQVKWSEVWSSQWYGGFAHNVLGGDALLFGLDQGYKPMKALDIHFGYNQYYDRLITEELYFQMRWPL